MSELLVVYGSGHKQELQDQLKAGYPDALILMGGFYFSPEMAAIQNKAIKEKRSLSMMLGDQKDDGKKVIMSSLEEESSLWAGIIKEAYSKGVRVYVMRNDLELFYKKENGWKVYFSFEKALSFAFGRRSNTYQEVDSPRGVTYVRDIKVVPFDDDTLVFWPRISSYQDDLYRFVGENTVLITDGQLEELKYTDLAHPRVAITPFRSKKTKTILVKDGLTKINL